MLQAAIGKLFTDRENPRRQDLKGVIYTNLDLGAVDRLTSKIGTLVNLDASPRRFNSSGRAVRPGQQVTGCLASWQVVAISFESTTQAVCPGTAVQPYSSTRGPWSRSRRREGRPDSG